MIGRIDDIIKVKGVLLVPKAIEGEMVMIFSELGDEYAVMLGKKGDVDTLLLKIEFPPAKEADQETIISRLKDQLRIKTSLGYQI